VGLRSPTGLVSHTASCGSIGERVRGGTAAGGTRGTGASRPRADAAASVD